MAARILVVDDDAVACDLLREVLVEDGYEVEVAHDGATAIALGAQKMFDVALLDVRMPDPDGLGVLRALKAGGPDAIVIMMTAFGSVESAIQAIRQGAYDYLRKPFNPEEIKVTIHQALERRRLIAENLRFKQALKEKYRIENIVGCSERMLGVSKLVARVAPTRSTVLIQGETGTGKELIARAIHYASSRSDRPFVAVDCSALAPGLLESELFGHVKGAFTGAVAARKGLFEEAHGGTCFIDEVGEASPSTQSRLLRVLQEQEIRRVGGTESRKVDVRVIAATQRDLERLVAESAFREDLFYRLSVVTIHLPPLRERREDIPLMARHFLDRYAAQHGKAVFRIASETMALLMAYDWPGNVRELQHAIERAVALTTSPILLPEDLPEKVQSVAGTPGASDGRPLPLRDVIRRHIQTVLDHAKGNKTLAAELLGLHRRTLYRLARRYGIPLRGEE